MDVWSQGIRLFHSLSDWLFDKIDRCYGLTAATGWQADCRTVLQVDRNIIRLFDLFDSLILWKWKSEIELEKEKIREKPQFGEKSGNQ